MFDMTSYVMGQKSAGGGGSGGGFVIPTYTEDEEGTTYTCDMTYAEVSAAVKSGQCICAKRVFWGGATIQYFSLDNINEGEDYGTIIFSYYQMMGTTPSVADSFRATYIAHIMDDSIQTGTMTGDFAK